MADGHNQDDIEARIKRLLSFERQEELDPFAVFAFIPIESNHHVADVGCGPAYFTVPLAKQLLYGKVYAIDVDDRMLAEARRRVEGSHLGNVEMLKSDGASVPVPAGSVDGALVAFVLHEVADKRKLLESVREALKPGGWLAVLEWQDKDVEGVPSPDRRVRPDALNRLATEAKLQPRSVREMNGRHYLAVFRKQGHLR